MTDIDRQVLEDAGISQKDAAEGLQLSQQRVSQLVNGKKFFLTPVRVEQLYGFLKQRAHPGAETFKAIAEKRLPGAVEHLRPAYVRSYSDSIIRPNDPRPWAEANEMWLFSAKPKEIYQPEYRASIRERFFAKKDDIKLQTIVYFVPSSVADQLCMYFNHYFLQISPKDRAKILVIESAAALISPRFVIFNPRSTKPIAVIVIDEDDNTYARLPQKQVAEILEGLAKSGLGGDMDDIYVLPPVDGLNRREFPEFKIRFHSLNDPMIIRG